METRKHLLNYRLSAISYQASKAAAVTATELNIMNASQIAKFDIDNSCQLSIRKTCNKQLPNCVACNIMINIRTITSSLFKGLPLHFLASKTII